MSKTDTVALHRQYGVFREYLASYFAAGARGRASAKDKLHRLPQEQFSDVSTDVHDEINRRLNSRDLPFLPVRTDLIPKRNQARQKMATLPVSRFKELAAGIYMEMERRYPEIEKEYTERYGPLHEAESEPSQPARSLPDISRQRSESGTREYSERWQSVREPSSSRDESRRAERSDRSERAERRPSQRRETRDRSRDVVRERDTSYGMDSKSLRDRSLTRDDFGKGTYSNSESEANIKADYEDKISGIKAEYEYKIAVLEGQVKLVAPLEQDKAFLEEENDKLHQDVQEKTDSLEALKSQMDQLNTENKFLQDDFSEQLRIIDSVRSEAATLLEDVAKLGAENRKILMERDDLADKAAMLEDRVSKLESQVEKQQRALEVKNARPEPPPPVQTSLRESSARSEASQPRVPEKSAPRRTSAATSPLASFESSAAKIMAAARKHPGSGVLAPMKSILLCCKSITEDCEALEDLKSTRPRDIDALQSAKDKISDSLTPLMNAAKQHASQGGNDGSAANIDSQLRTVGHAFSDLAELMVLIRSKGPSPQMAEPAPASPDTVPDTAEYKGSGQSNDPPAIDVRDLIYYLEDQTDDIAHAIQNLLQAMRKAPSDINEITSLVDNILVFVDNIIFETKATIDATPSLHQDMVADCDDVLEFLEQDRKRLLILIEKVGDLHDQRAAKQEIANCSYEMAKHAKELLSIIDY